MQGLHLTADLSDCRCEASWLTDAARLGECCVALVQAAGLQPVAELFHSFASGGQGPGGVTATVLLAESHLCVHTWPEQAAVTLDVYVCNFSADNSAKAEQLTAALLALFQARQVVRTRTHRGRPNQAMPAASPAAWPKPNASSNTE
jgi:S-adenosylmethionine decarboxylase